MIESIQLCRLHALRVCRLGGLSFTPSINIIIGPNKSGKSTILKALHNCPHCHTTGTSSSSYLNTSTMNPHAPTAPPGDMRNMMLRIRGMFSSHGEIAKKALSTLPLRKHETLLIDEPEAGQDIAGMHQILSAFNIIAQRGGQVIAATHHPLLLRGTNVIELVDGWAETMLDECKSILQERQ